MQVRGKKIKSERRALTSGRPRTVARAQASVRSNNGKAPQKKMGGDRNQEIP